MVNAYVYRLKYGLTPIIKALLHTTEQLYSVAFLMSTGTHHSYSLFCYYPTFNQNIPVSCI